MSTQATPDLIAKARRTGCIRPDYILSPAPQAHYHKAFTESSFNKQSLKSLKQNISHRKNAIRFTKTAVEPNARLMDAELYQECLKESVREVKRRGILATTTENECQYSH